MNRSRKTGDLVSQNNLFVDITNDRIGIGSTVPGNKLSLPDSAKIGLGNAEDLTLHHDGTHSYITNTTGDLRIVDTTGMLLRSNSLDLRNGAGDENYITCAANGTVKLYYNNSEKLATTSVGINVTGTVTCDGSTHDGDVTFTGATSGRDIVWDKSADELKVKDNTKISFGTDRDLQLSHNNSDSVISHIAGATGNLKILSGGAQSIECVKAGAVNIAHNGSTKLATTSTGATIYQKLRLSGTYPRLDFTDTNNNPDWSIINNDGILGIYDDTNGAYKLNVTTSGHIQLPNDSQQLQLGASQDLSVFHDGTHSYIQTTTGNLVLTSVANELGVRVRPNAEVELYHDNSKKLATTSSGVTISGNVNIPDSSHLYLGASNDLDLYHTAGADSFLVTSSGQMYQRYANNLYIQLTGSNENAIVANANGAVELYHNNSKKIETTSSGVTITGYLGVDELGLGDNEKAKFGNGEDLQIYHNASHSYINNSTGNLNLQTSGNVWIENQGGTKVWIKALADAAVELYHNNSKKFETTSSGATVTGTLTATTLTGALSTTDACQTGDLTILNGTPDLKLQDSNHTGNNTEHMIAFKDSSGNNQMNIGSPFGEQHLRIKHGTTDLVKIQTDGKVGINESSPDAPLHITGGLPHIRLENSGTSASAGDVLGQIDFKHNDSDDAGVTAAIKCIAEDNAGNSYLTFNNGDGGNADERLRITSGGLVNIGAGANTAMNGSGLKIYWAQYPAIQLQNSTTGTNNTDGSEILLSGDSHSGLFINNRENSIIRFGTNNTERLRIESGGAVIVGTDAGQLQFGNPSGYNPTFKENGGALEVWTNNAKRWTVESNGNNVYEDDVKIFFGSSNDFRFWHDGNDNFIWGTGNHATIFATNNTEKLRITAAGVIKILGDGQNDGFYLSNAYGQAGFFGGMYYNGSAWVRAAAGSRKPAGMYVNTGGHIVFLTASETSGTSATVTERLRITSDGKVGIGNRTTSPNELLHVHTSSGQANIHVEGATDGQIILRAHSGDSVIHLGDASATSVGKILYDHGTDSLQFTTNSSERLRITSGVVASFGNSSPPAWANDTGYYNIQLGKTGFLRSDTDTSNTFMTVGQNAYKDSGGWKYAQNGGASSIFQQNGDIVFESATSGTAGNALSLTEKLRITSVGRLLLNTTTEGNAGADDLTIGQISGSTGITVRSGTTNNGNLYFSDGTSGDDEYRGSIQYQHANNSLHIATNAVERLIITSAGKVCINNDNALSDLHVCTAGSSEQDGTLRIGGSGSSLGLVLDYDQSNATVSRITANPTYTNGNALLKICVDGDAYANQLVLRGDGKIGINIADNTTADLQVRTGTNGAGIFRLGGASSSGIGMDMTYSNSGATSTVFKQNYRATNAGALMKFDSGYFAFHTGTAGTQAFVIQANGNTDIYASQVHLYNSANTSNTYFVAQNTGAGNAGIKLKNNQGEWTLIANDRLRFIDDDAGIERLSITSAGNIGINKTAPAAQLHIGGPSEIRLDNASDAGNFARIRCFEESGNNHAILAFSVGSGEKLRIANDGQLRIGTTSTGTASVVIDSTLGSGSALRFIGKSSNGGSEIDFYANNNSTRLGYIEFNDEVTKIVSETDVPFKITTNGASNERLRIDSNGNIGVNCASPTNISGHRGITLKGTNSNAGFINFMDSADNSDARILATDGELHIHADPSDNTGSSEIVFFVDNSRKAFITHGGTLHVGGAISNSADIDSNHTKLIIKQSDNDKEDGIYMERSNERKGYYIYMSSSGGAGDSLVFARNSNGTKENIMCLDRDGNVFVGQTSRGQDTTSSNLSVYGNSSNTTANIPASFHCANVTSTRYLQSFCNGNGVVGSIRVNGTQTYFNTSSDYRLKENITPLTDAFTRLNALKPCRFNFKSDPSKTLDGFIAHEVEEVVPHAVAGEKDGMKPITFYEEGDTLPDGKEVGDGKTYSTTEIEPQQLDDSKLIPLLTAALQESVTEIENLKTKNSQLATLLDELKVRLDNAGL